jgi:hypothetical protein
MPSSIEEQASGKTNDSTLVPRIRSISERIVVEAVTGDRAEKKPAHSPLM